jgi:hypothetical protein
MRTLQHADFVALLAAVNVSQAGFTRVCGRQRPAKSINGAPAGPARSPSRCATCPRRQARSNLKSYRLRVRTKMTLGSCII